MPLHIIKMTMIVIFVPSPPHPLPHLESATRPSLRLLLAYPPTHLRATSRSWALCEREKEICLSLSLSLTLPFVQRRRDTRRDREDSEIPSRPGYSLLSLGPAHRSKRARVLAYSYVPFGVSFSLIPPLTRSFLTHAVQRFPSVRPKVSRRAGLYLRRAARLSARAEEGSSSSRASVGRPRTAYTCIARLVHKRRQ